MDDAPQTEHGSGLAGLIAPVGRRVLGRHARLMRASGLRLGEAVAERHEMPEAAKAARRLAPVRLVTRTPAPAPAAPTAPAEPPAATGESTIMPGLSDWAAEYLFGDADAAVSTGQAWMGGAGLQPRTPEELRLSRIKRGGPEVARAARILEGDETPPAAGAKRLARRPTPDAPVAGPTPSEPAPAAPPRPPAHEAPASPPSERAAGTPPAATVARTARDTPAPPAGETAREVAARATGEPPAPPSPPAGEAPRPTAPPSPPAGGATRPTVARASAETPAPPAAPAGEATRPAPAPPSPPAAEAPRPTPARATAETPAPLSPPAGQTARPTLARATGDTPGGEAAPPTVAPAAGETPGAAAGPTLVRATGETPAPTVAPAAGETPGAATRPTLAPAAGETPGAATRPTLAPAAGETPGAATRPTVAPAAGETPGAATRPTLARASGETPAPPASARATDVGATPPPAKDGTAARAVPSSEPAAAPRPTVARVARAATASRRPGLDDTRSGAERAPAQARPAVQRVARPDPELVPVAPPAPPPTLLRRIADRFRAPASAAPTATPAPPPRAAVTRLGRIDLQPSAPEPPVSETPAIRGTNPERLARMLGTEVTHDEQGNATVAMPDYVPFSTAPRTVSRAETDVPSHAEPASTTTSPPLEAVAAEAPGVDMDAIADTVIDKLRRELLVEREQAGGPMDLI